MKPNSTINEIIIEVCRVADFPWPAGIGSRRGPGSRTPKAVEVRYVAIALAKMFGHSLPDISSEVGLRGDAVRRAIRKAPETRLWKIHVASALEGNERFP